MQTTRQMTLQQVIEATDEVVFTHYNRMKSLLQEEEHPIYGSEDLRFHNVIEHWKVSDFICDYGDCLGIDEETDTVIDMVELNLHDIMVAFADIFTWIVIESDSFTSYTTAIVTESGHPETDKYIADQHITLTFTKNK